MRHYLYKGVEYKSEREVRNAIFEQERKAFARCYTADDWAKHGVVYTEVEVQLTEEQMAVKARQKRDAFLAKSDFYVMPDYPSTEEGLAEVKAYRQALRDITKQEGFPADVVWPDIPGVLK